MFTFFVFESKSSSAFRVMFARKGETVDHPGDYSQRAYQGRTIETAARTAHSAETRADIRAQIERFFTSSAPSTSVSPSDTRETSQKSLSASPAPSAANGGAGISLYCGNAWCGAKLPGPYGTPGVSLSRFDNKTLLCSDCGTLEAFGRVPAYKV